VFAIGEEPVILWRRGEPFPQAVADHIAAGGEMRAWNAQFERIIWREVAVPVWGWPAVPDDQWFDTAAEAAAMALPRGLGACAAVLGIEEQKDKEGYGLMLRMARPRKILPDGTPEWWDLEEKKERLYAYCIQDVLVERRIAKAVRRLIPSELEVFRLDQRINDRGVATDPALIRAAQRVVVVGLGRAAEQLVELTGGAVTKVTQTAKIKSFLATLGLAEQSLAKAPLAALLDGDLPDLIRSVLEVRSDAGKSSHAKLGAMLDCACTDGKMRGLLLYHGASTGRWSGKLAQPHNFPRPLLDDPEYFIPGVLAGDYDGLDLLAHPLQIVTDLLRSCMTASAGCRLVAADYSGIEAKVITWLAGEWGIVKKWAAKEDIYMFNAFEMARMNGTPLPVGADKKTHAVERQGGKAVELGCGFQMGPAKFQKSAKDVFGLTITEDEAIKFVKFYRATHPKVVQYWRDLNDSAKAAVQEPGTVHWVGEGAKVALTQRGGYLWLLLPSGRPLCYARPRIQEVLAPWSTEEEPKYVSSVTCEGVGFNQQWERYALYGGLLAENITQAVARDFMAEGMLRTDHAGYPVVLSVHDEVVADVPVGTGTLAEFVALLEVQPAWALQGPLPCPITAEGWEGLRYRK
jgi:DNA polymerase